MKLCSACLLGVNCRYDGSGRPHKAVLDMLEKGALIPVCPEQLGGLSTPREPSERKGNRVISQSGRDVTENFEKGAKETLKIARIFGIKEAIFKERSASCGSGGVATELLKRNGIKVVSEEEVDSKGGTNAI